MKIKKLVLKFYDEDADAVKWMHVCYISSALYNEFLDKMHITKEEFADYISDWFFKDFGLRINMSTKRDLNILKATVKEKYRAIFPTIYNNTKIDSQGWLRVWLSQKMEEELKNV